MIKTFKNRKIPLDNIVTIHYIILNETKADMKTVMENANTGDIIEFDEDEFDTDDVEDISDEDLFAFLEEILEEIEELIDTQINENNKE